MVGTVPPGGLSATGGVLPVAFWRVRPLVLSASAWTVGDIGKDVVFMVNKAAELAASLKPLAQRALAETEARFAGEEALTGLLAEVRSQVGPVLDGVLSDAAQGRIDARVAAARVVDIAEQLRLLWGAPISGSGNDFHDVSLELARELGVTQIGQLAQGAEVTRGASVEAAIELSADVRRIRLAVMDKSRQMRAMAY